MLIGKESPKQAHLLIDDDNYLGERLVGWLVGWFHTDIPVPV